MKTKFQEKKYNCLSQGQGYSGESQISGPEYISEPSVLKFPWNLKFSVSARTCVPKLVFKGTVRGGEGWHMNLTWLSGHIEWTFIDSCLDLLTYWLCPHCPDSFEEKDNIGISASMHHPRDFGASREQNEVAIEYNCLAALLLQFSNPILDTTIKLKESLRKWFLFSVFSLQPFRERYQTTLSPSEI